MEITLPTTSDIISAWTSEQKRQLFENELRCTGRQGIEVFLSSLSQTDFYIAPGSMGNHSNYSGGLLDHTLCMYITMMNLRSVMISQIPEYESAIKVDSVRIVALLHDLCKVNFYKPATKWKRNNETHWEPYQGYEVDDPFPYGHGEKSVLLAMSFGLQLDSEEMLAIRWHMGAWDGAPMGLSERKAYMKASNDHKLVTLAQMADYMSSMMFEGKVENS